jgi:hypothetical protein
MRLYLPHGFRYKSVLNEALRLSFQPNPVSSGVSLSVSVANLKEGRGELKITDILGRLFYQQVLNDDRAELTIHTGDLFSGIYYMQLTSGTEITVKRLVIY